MFRFSPARRKTGQPQSGYILLAVIFAVTLMIIALATALPAIGTQIKRDREEELIHRGRQYVRAIRLYYRKFGRYPNSLDDLENTNNMRFLRRKYKDPITGKDEWRVIHVGEAQPKPIPPYMSRQGGAGGVSGGGLTGGTPAGSLSAGPAQNTGSGAINASSISQRLGSSSSTPGGIGPIVGVASTSDRKGLKEMDGKTKYSDWEFVYDPSLDTGRIAAGKGAPGPGTTPTSGPNTPRPPGPNR